MESRGGGATHVEEGPLFGPRVEVGDRSGLPAKLKDSEITQAAIMCVLHAMLPQGHFS